MSPKSLLRHPNAKSPFSHMLEGMQCHALFAACALTGLSPPATSGTSFKRVIADSSSAEPSGVKRLVFCAGKIYYELAAQRERAGQRGDVAIARLEQLSPFPYDLVRAELERFPQAELVWAQEEPKNMGAWAYVQTRLSTAAAATSRPVR